MIMRRTTLYLLLLVPLLYLSFYSQGNSGDESARSKRYDSIIGSVMRYTKRNHVHKSKIEPKKMLVAGMDKLEQRLDDVMVTFKNGEKSRSFLVQVGDDKRSFNMSDIRTIDDMSDRVEDVFSFVFPKIDSEEVKPREVEYAVIDAMLKTLDAHSGIIPPKVYKEFMVETEGSFGGLGIVIGIRDGQLTVIAPIEGTPAYRVGIKSNDKIVQIEQESTVNMTLIEAVSKLRGPKGTVANINVMRKGFNASKPFAIVRDTIKIESVEAFDLGDDIGYIRIRDFQKNTLDSIKEHVQQLNNGEPFKGLIIDLRGNPGGLLDQAEKISDLFLDSGVIVTTRVGRSERSYRARPSAGDFEGGIVLLVDSGSASASEIVAGALKNNKRALVIGERTFGKGSVQQIFDLKDGSALKLTIADYLTPGHISIQDVGITPDIEVLPAIINDKLVFFPYPSENGRHKRAKENKKVLGKPAFSITYIDQNSNRNTDEEPTPEEAMTRE